LGLTILITGSFQIRNFLKGIPSLWMIIILTFYVGFVLSNLNRLGKFLMKKSKLKRLTGVAKKCRYKILFLIKPVKTGLRATKTSYLEGLHSTLDGVLASCPAVPGLILGVPKIFWENYSLIDFLRFINSNHSSDSWQCIESFIIERIHSILVRAVVKEE